MKLINSRIGTSRKNPVPSLLKISRRRRRNHDPMLVLNMSIFNSGSGWQEIFSAFKARENVG
jgi:hypothetical protein